jgi:hypothetical protein
LNFSSTPKWHVLLNHAADQLEQMDGFADMGEAASNEIIRVEKRIVIETLDEVKKIQSEVQEHSRRNLKRAVPLWVERESV